MNKLEVQKLKESDWWEYKIIRLQSLQDSPNSFGSTYEREIQFSEEQWKSRLRATKANAHSLLWVAAVDTKLIGLLSMVIDSSNPNKANLYQMWVAPKYRQMGAGEALLNKALEKAMQTGVENVYLSVTSTNTEALSLYKKVGFTETGAREPLRERSALESITMKREFAPIPT